MAEVRRNGWEESHHAEKNRILSAAYFNQE
jgi:hypothetical protein